MPALRRSAIPCQPQMLRWDENSRLARMSNTSTGRATGGIRLPPMTAFAHQGRVSDLASARETGSQEFGFQDR